MGTCTTVPCPGLPPAHRTVTHHLRPGPALCLGLPPSLPAAPSPALGLPRAPLCLSLGPLDLLLALPQDLLGGPILHFLLRKGREMRRGG